MRPVLFFFLLSTITSLAQVPVPSFQSVNSSDDEQSPVLTPDGSTVYFTISNHVSNVGGKKDPGDIWYATRTGDGWSLPVHADASINDRMYNAVAGFSAKGDQMFLLSHYNKDGNVKSQGISVSRRSGSGWTFPENISIPYFQNKSSLQSGQVSSDGKVFIFSAETYGSYGVEDIYVSTKGDDGKWSEPKNLGPTINTQFQELTPSLGADGKTIYFSSNGRKGMGSFDIYKSTRLDDTWTNWTEPDNLGPQINSGGRELFAKEYSGFLLYTSTTNSDGYGDVKVFIPKDYVPPVDTSTLIAQNEPESPVATEPVSEPANGSVIHVYGKITDASTSAMIHAKIVFTGETNYSASTEITSGYNVSVPTRGKYTVKIESPGYISTLEKLDISTLESDDLEMNFQLQPIVVGTTVNLKNVLFVQSKPELLPESFDELNLVVEFLKANPNVRIELAGHTDNRGIQSHNVRLSTARVNTVKDYLVEHGVDKKRISGKGYGGSNPIASNDTEETRRLNRRVEFTIKKM